MAALAADITAYLHATGQAPEVRTQIQLGADKLRADCARYGVTG